MPNTLQVDTLTLCSGTFDSCVLPDVKYISNDGQSQSMQGNVTGALLSNQLLINYCTLCVLENGLLKSVRAGFLSK